MTRPINPVRLILATILAPLIASILALLLMVAVKSNATEAFDHITTLAIISLMLALLVGWPAMLIIGLPAHGVLCAKNMRRWYYYAIAGALGGMLAVLVFLIIAEGGANVPLSLLAIASISGGFAAVLFHLMRGPHLALTPPSNPGISSP